MSVHADKSDSSPVLSDRADPEGGRGVAETAVVEGVADNEAYVPDANAKERTEMQSMKSVTYNKPEGNVEDTTSIRDLAIKYAAKSTVHGLPSTVANSIYTGQRCFWFLMVFSMAASLSVVIGMQLKSYYEWPTVINIQETPMSAFDIPEVTICGQEPMAFTFYSDVWKDKVQDFRMMNLAVHTETLVLSNAPGCNDTDQSGQCLLDKANSTERTRLLTSSLDRGGWNFPDSEFYKKVVTDMGVCNTFKTSELLKVLEAKNVSLDSAEVPLDIVLAVKPSFTWSFPGHRVGLQVTLHTKDETPFPRKKKVFVPVNTSCRIKYKKTIRRALTTPYKSFTGEQCIDTEVPSFVNPLTRYSTYTEESCLAECFVNFTIAHCGCRYYLHPGDEKMCSSKVTPRCMEESSGLFGQHNKRCNCTAPCVETEFDSYLSSSEIVKPEYHMIHLELMSAAAVKTEILQVPVYSLETILGSIGGMIGLFMGFSLVSLMEFVELIVIAVTQCCACLKHKRRP
ncbi:acid-sensing ion channel 1-like [Haliotis rubra]|uniref:acid-sensing ion channel 1-like n=1 Tax=Haliotis rubra TaxID=36100 RepID=UPI001EE63044|nr:acid-sensing ion channel 1-like [Haliotis rubra]